MKTHYETLGVPSTATHDEIKTAFRKLCLVTHPDVTHSTATTTAGRKNKNANTIERFKQISEAHRVLTNKRERQIYDMELKTGWNDYKRQRPGYHHHQENKFYGQNRSSNFSSSYRSHEFLGGALRSRNVGIGIGFGLCLVTLYNMQISSSSSSSSTKVASSKYNDDNNNNSNLVEAWMNPQTGQYELAAPWDQTYRKLKPKLHLVPRDQVQQRHFK